MTSLQKIRKLSDEASIWYRIDSTKSFPGDDFIIAETWEWNVYLGESWEIEESATVVDIGAHIGAFSLFAAVQAVSGRVCAYEPFPGNFDLLMKNLEFNKISNVVAVRKAVSGRQGKERLYLDPRSESGHSLVKETSNWIDVPTITLGDLFEHHSILSCDFLKLDCEGAERDIILETPLHILQRIRRIALEYHPKILEKRILYAMINRLEIAGFRVVAINEEKLFLPVLFERDNLGKR